MTKSALWQQLATYPAQLDRQLIASKWPNPGALVGMGVTVGAGRIVNIAPGSFVVALGAGMGSALCVSDAIETATFAAAPGAGSSRIDLLVTQVHDMALDAGGANGFTFDVVTGVPAASPVAPAVPARAGVLARVTSVGGQANLAQANIAHGDIAAAAWGMCFFAGNSITNTVGPLAGSGFQGAGMAYASPNFTIQHPGLYLARMTITLAGNGGNPQAAYWQPAFYQNGVTLTTGRNVGDLYGPWPTMNTTETIVAAPGDLITPYMQGAQLNTSVSINSGQMSIMKIG